MAKRDNVRQRIAEIHGLTTDIMLPDIVDPVITEAFSKQHYVAIANILAKYKDKTARGIATDLSQLFHNDNSAFDEERFLQACGLKA